MKPFYDNFLAALEERYPSKSELVNALVDLLHLEKESVYRRLRKDVLFSADEMMHISGSWNISLDNIIFVNPRKSHSFHLKILQFLDPQEEDYVIMEQHNRDLELVAADPAGMSIKIVNALPRGLYAKSEPLTRFFFMKWRHKFAPEKALNFCDVHLSERMKEINSEYCRIERCISEMHSIHDPRLVKNLVDEIVYYRSIGMLTREDAALLREELLKLVDYVENVSLTGYFPDTGNKMFFYLSHTWIETEYLLFKSKNFNLSLVKVMECNNIASYDKNILDRFMKTLLATKRMSVLMSESNALKQAEFFTLQRNIIKTL